MLERSSFPAGSSLGRRVYLNCQKEQKLVAMVKLSFLISRVRGKGGGGVRGVSICLSCEAMVKGFTLSALVALEKGRIFFFFLAFPEGKDFLGRWDNLAKKLRCLEISCHN